MSVRPRLTVHQGEGRKRREKLDSRDAVARLLLETGLDVLRRKASTERSAWIGRRADEVLWLFENAPRSPALQLVLERKLDELEALVRELRSEP